MNVIYLANHHCIELRSLTNSATSVVDTGATVTVTLLNSARSEVAGQTWPASMPHVASGTYRVTLDDDLALVANRTYTAVIDATGSGGEVGHWEVPLKSMVRTS